MNNKKRPQNNNLKKRRIILMLLYSKWNKPKSEFMPVETTIVNFLNSFFIRMSQDTLMFR
jgi:hypothetical protein